MTPLLKNSFVGPWKGDPPMEPPDCCRFPVKARFGEKLGVLSESVSRYIHTVKLMVFYVNQGFSYVSLRGHKNEGKFLPRPTMKVFASGCVQMLGLSARQSHDISCLTFCTKGFGLRREQANCQQTEKPELW